MDEWVNTLSIKPGNLTSFLTQHDANNGVTVAHYPLTLTYVPMHMHAQELIPCTGQFFHQLNMRLGYLRRRNLK